MRRERKSNRLQGYDYSRNNLYFVTLCVQDRLCCLGKVINGKMYPNEYGEIVEERWFWLSEQYPYVRSHIFIVMPNHVHGILEINRTCPKTGINLSKEMKIKSLSELMGAFQTTASKAIHLAGFDGFSWQRSFHDHIIRKDGSYQYIYDYIKNNPKNWDEDTFYEEDED